MRFQDMNWMDVESYLEEDRRIILVLGSCEQHGYLSLTSDTNIPQSIADAASERTGVPVAPAVPYGVSPYFQAYPGTISLTLETFLALVENLLRDLHRGGFRRILLLNGHGGNTPAKMLCFELAAELKDLKIWWFPWWESSEVRGFIGRIEGEIFHAGWAEAFPFNQISEIPEVEKVPVVIEEATDPKAIRIQLGNGVFGGEYQTSQDRMEELFDAALLGVVNQLESMLD